MYLLASQDKLRTYVRKFKIWNLTILHYFILHHYAIVSNTKNMYVAWIHAYHLTNKINQTLTTMLSIITQRSWKWNEQCLRPTRILTIHDKQPHQWYVLILYLNYFKINSFHSAIIGINADDYICRHTRIILFNCLFINSKWYLYLSFFVIFPLYKNNSKHC